MKLKALNGEKAAKYGYESELGYENPNFHGHQIGICIGVLDTDTNEIVRNSLPVLKTGSKERDSLLRKIIADESIIKVESIVTCLENDKLVPRTVYYLPYAVIDHSVFQPTINFANISTAMNATNNVTVEILFVTDGLNRYVTYTYCTSNVSIMDEIYEMNDPLDIPGLEFREKTEDEDAGYYLDFYNEAGDKTMLCFNNWEALRSTITSVRVIDIETRIDNN